MEKNWFALFRKYFFTGLFVVIPVGLTVFMVVWIVRVVDNLLGAPIERFWGFHLPGLGLVVTVVLFVFIGMLMSNVLFQQIFEIFEEMLMRVPGVRTVYRTIKALTDAFSPKNQKSFRNVVLVEYPHPGAYALGFATGRTALTREEDSSREFVSVYVPTNHFYLGDVLVIPREKVITTNLSVQEGIQIVLSSGASFPDRVNVKSAGGL